LDQRAIEAKPLPAEDEAAMASNLTLPPPGQFGLYLSDGLRGPIGGRHLERALTYRERIEPHCLQLFHEGGRDGACKGPLQRTLKLALLAQQSRCVEIEQRRVENEAGNGRAGGRIAVGIKRATAEGQVGRYAQAYRCRDDVQVAWRGHHGITREGLVN